MCDNTQNLNYCKFTKANIITPPLDTVFRVYYLEAKLSLVPDETLFEHKAIRGTNLVSINAYHTGIGFQSTDPQNPLEYWFDYTADSFGIDVFLPKIVQMDDGSKELLWNNGASVGYSDAIQTSYWIKSTYICNVSSTQLLSFQQWILDTFLPRNQYYQSFVASENRSREAIFNPILRAAICDTFCIDAYEYFQSQLGSCIQYVSFPYESVFALILYDSVSTITLNQPNENPLITYNERIQQLDYTDPVQKAEIIAFYEYIERAFQNYLENNNINSASIFQPLTLLGQALDLQTPEQRLLTLRAVRFDTKTGPLLLAEFLAQNHLPYVILYDYSPIDNTMQYFKVIYDSVDIAYIPSDLEISNGGMCVSGEGVCSQPSNTSNWGIYILFAVIILIILGLLIFAIVYSRKS